MIGEASVLTLKSAKTQIIITHFGDEQNGEDEQAKDACGDW